MKSIVSRAAQGQRQALWALYDRSAQATYYVASLLLADEEQASQATAQVLSCLWGRLVRKEWKPENDAAWDELLLQELIAECKKRVASHDSKAYRIPSDRRFLIASPAPVVGNDVAAALAQMNPLQRLVFVLHTATPLDEKTQMSIVKLDARTYQTALDDERQNAENMGLNYATVCRQAADGVKTVKLPVSLQDAVTESIRTLSASYEKTHRKNTLTVLGCVAACCVVLCAITGALLWQMWGDETYTTSGDGNSATTTTTQATDEEISAALANKGTVTTVENPTHYATIDIKDYGKIRVALDGNTAPKTVANFVKLAKSGFYNGLTFHRIMEDFMMQGGDPNGNGSGGAKETVDGEFGRNGFANPLSHVRGAISMARSSDLNGASSQFFIVHEDSTYLDGEYAAFGYVVEGIEVVDAVCEAAQPTDNNGTIPAAQQPVINSITIEEIPQTA